MTQPWPWIRSEARWLGEIAAQPSAYRRVCKRHCELPPSKRPHPASKHYTHVTLAAPDRCHSLAGLRADPPHQGSREGIFC